MLIKLRVVRNEVQPRNAERVHVLPAKASICVARPRPRKAGSTYSAHRLGAKSVLGWKSFSMTPAPATMRRSLFVAKYHCGTRAPARQARMLCIYSVCAMPHCSLNQREACSRYSGASRRAAEPYIFGHVSKASFLAFRPSHIAPVRCSFIYHSTSAWLSQGRTRCGNEKIPLRRRGQSEGGTLSG